MKNILPVVLAVLIPVQMASAQQADIATDAELHAAYCVGEAQQASNQQLITGRTDIDPPTSRAFAAQIARFKDYLSARGLFSGKRGILAVRGINLAAERGQQDEITCSKQIAHCVIQCSKPPRRYSPECVDDCRALEPACLATGRCWKDTDNTPF